MKQRWPSLTYGGQVIDPTTHTYTCVYIYIYMLWSYYLVQVWGFGKLLSGPSLFFLKHRLPNNTIKIVVSAHYLEQKTARTTFWKLLSGPSWRF